MICQMQMSKPSGIYIWWIYAVDVLIRYGPHMDTIIPYRWFPIYTYNSLSGATNLHIKNHMVFSYKDHMANTFICCWRKIAVPSAKLLKFQ